MTPDQWIVSGVVLGALVLFISEKFSIDLVALLILVTLVGTGVITPGEALNGFSDQATITVAFMFVLSAALLRTGAVATIGPRLSRIFRSSPAMGGWHATLRTWPRCAGSGSPRGNRSDGALPSPTSTPLAGRV